MEAQKKKGKKGRKIGNKRDKPWAKRRRIERPDLMHKAWNVLTTNGPEALVAWTALWVAKQKDAMGVIYLARDRAVKRKAARLASA